MVGSFPIALAVGTVLGFLTGLGIGGGSLLILWLTLVLGFPQETARTLNLLFFLPAALISSCFRLRRGTISVRRILPAIVSGCLAAIVFSRIGLAMDLFWLKKAFGILLVVIGIRELFYRPRA